MESESGFQTGIREGVNLGAWGRVLKIWGRCHPFFAMIKCNPSCNQLINQICKALTANHEFERERLGMTSMYHKMINYLDWSLLRINMPSRMLLSLRFVSLHCKSWTEQTREILPSPEDFLLRSRFSSVHPECVLQLSWWYPYHLPWRESCFSQFSCSVQVVNCFSPAEPQKYTICWFLGRLKDQNIFPFRKCIAANCCTEQKLLGVLSSK